MGKSVISSETGTAEGAEQVGGASRKPSGGNEQASPKEPPLKGTFTAVMLLGGFIIVSWLLVFALFMSRN